ncbi:MAG: type II toxin-antitoxin system prevent-host-death family antitoxin [Methylibium sp.]|uniref:type II toxin-antitoxin system Phd/YefM family antitoxin n=1 Tax=Methylibium sp. TaxID=2067992 RepID=UPI00183B9C88|nr:type II toxin-antitoxin system prevent-host-death family antitoxin [Methylibium sp.]MBA2724246.1 type II toxin-antitoxin system prevent-host-death family antitoxin [Methylibium sp.]MBA3588548.1 type II toxin-antitoxin system prevent-host-death family antitoxin [Methylibium sp.]
MHSPNIHEVRENLAEYVAAAERGEEVLICRRNQPVAKLVALGPQRSSRPRPLGRAPDAGEPLPDCFFEALPAELLAALTGTVGAVDPLVAAGSVESTPAASRAKAPAACASRRPRARR